MKAPDKIFLPDDIDWPSAAILTLGNQPGDVEYIRKDVLMELLKPEHDVAYCEDYERGCIDGRNALRKELIDKLNEM